MSELDDVYLAFANWRFQVQRASKIRQSIFFFRRSFDHTLIWTLVMRGHYRKSLPTVRDCQNAASCSRLTTRKLLADAEALGFLVIRPAPDDSRKRLVHPTPRAVAEYEAMVKRYLGLWETLLVSEPGLRSRARRGGRKAARKTPAKAAEIRQK
ncbi:MAG TPA: hypothetical protein VL966_18505 [Alphaproteobacteria bacterium]|jgi:DNA-binding MarR family transcriptional regulator|nr:hypothetical protein [Alphaproteobacteria bacterium]